MVATLANSALIVIDPQIGFVNAASAPAVPVMADLLARWQDAGAVTIMTQFINGSDSQYVRIIGWSALMSGSPECEFAPEVARFADSASLVLRKGGYTALTDELVQFLRDRGIEHLWISGLDTESCVLATALSAFEAGFIPWVLTDACASHAGPAVHDAGLLVMSRNLGAAQLVTTALTPEGVGGRVAYRTISCR
jgi:nicotinamidase-related amidase